MSQLKLHWHSSRAYRLQFVGEPCSYVLARYYETRGKDFGSEEQDVLCIPLSPLTNTPDGSNKLHRSYLEMATDEGRNRRGRWLLSFARAKFIR